VRFELAIEIARPPDEVFTYLTDVSNLPEWQRSAESADADGPIRKGSRIRERRSFLGRTMTTELEVVAYDPPHRFDVTALGGPLRFTIQHTLADAARGTRLEVVGEAQITGLLRVAGAGAAKLAEHEFRGDFERLKEILEGEGA
jgi:carbon monoxide dehydrogenase subunit G